MRHGALAACLALAALAPSVASAAGVDPADATPIQREQAQARFVRGKALFEQRNYAAALEEFRGSIGIVQSPNARLYVARCYREMGRLVDAYVEFGRTAVEAREHAAADGRYDKAAEAAKAEREALAPKLGFVTVRVANPGADTTLRVGGTEIPRAGWTEPAPVMPGEVEVEATTPGYAPARQTVSVAAGQRVEITLDAGTAGAEGAPAPGTAALAGEASSGGKRPPFLPIAIAAGGVGVAGMIVFAAAGASSLATYDDLKRKCGLAPCPNTPAFDAEISSGRTSQAVANVGLVFGIVGLAAGATFLTLHIVSGKKSESSPPAALVVGPSSVGLRGTF
jgi:hypothetical protein